MASSDPDFEKMIRGFRVCDLQKLLAFAGRSKMGKKPELQFRALGLLKLHSGAIEIKIREIHNQKHGNQPEMYAVSQQMPVASGYGSQRPMRNGSHRNMRAPAMSEYMPNLNKHMLSPPSHMSNESPQYPQYPQVRFKVIPFYDILTEIIRPTSLIPSQDGVVKENEYKFLLLPHQVANLQSGTNIQVQVRICLLDQSCDQEDELPSSICLKVNNIVVPLPNPVPAQRTGPEPKRPKKPIDITPWIKKTNREPNMVSLSWASQTSKPHVLGIFLVRKLSSADLTRRLKANGVRNPDYTTSIIKEKLRPDSDAEIATMSLSGSLMCPLGKVKMQLPSRALTCTHLQCFEAALYLQMNEKKPKWICPVCDQPALFRNLVIDGLFLDIICKVPNECTEVQFHEDGSWTPVINVKKPAEISDATFDSAPKDVPKEVEVSKPKRPVEVIDLDSDSDTEESWSVVPPKKRAVIPPEGKSSIFVEYFDNMHESPTLKTEPFNPFIPSTSKTELSCSVPKNTPTIPDKSTLEPLPEFLSIDSCDVDCVLGDVPPTSDTGPISRLLDHPPLPSNSPVYIPPPPPPEMVLNSDGVDILHNSQDSTRHFSNFNLFSLIQPDQEENFDYHPHSPPDSPSPDIIDID